MKTLKDMALSGKKVFVRADFNVPLNDGGEITEDFRIRSVLPTIKYILGQGALLILASHLGRPKGKPDSKFSLKPVQKRLAELLDMPVDMAADAVGPETSDLVNGKKPGDVVLLENLRFHKEETDDDDHFALRLASLCDVYVNDAFAVSHRANASVHAIAGHVKEKCAGFLLEKELTYFNKAMKEPQRPLVAVIGGVKVSDKIGALKNIISRADKLLIGGAMANTFLKSCGVDMQASRVEDEKLNTAKELLDLAGSKNVKCFLPVDGVCAPELAPDAPYRYVSVYEIPKDWMMLDIGPATTTLFKEVLYDAKTIVWNGPMGVFEMDAFSRGTMGVANAVADAHALSIVGGGDSDAACAKAGVKDAVSYISTGGGAFLTLLEGAPLPGIEALS